jgi:hypothetical protein
MRIYSGNELGKHLIAEGLCPPQARSIELLIEATDAVRVRYEIMLTQGDFAKLARAFAKLEGDEVP